MLPSGYYDDFTPHQGLLVIFLLTMTPIIYLKHVSDKWLQYQRRREPKCSNDHNRNVC